MTDFHISLEPEGVRVWETTRTQSGASRRVGSVPVVIPADKDFQKNLLAHFEAVSAGEGLGESNGVHNG